MGGWGQWGENTSLEHKKVAGQVRLLPSSGVTAGDELLCVLLGATCVPGAPDVAWTAFLAPK